MLSLSFKEGHHLSGYATIGLGVNLTPIESTSKPHPKSTLTALPAAS